MKPRKPDKPRDPGPATKPAPISTEQIRAATAELGAVRQRMALVPLTAAERREHEAMKIGPKTLRTLENRLVAARQHRDLLPAAFDLRKFERDAALTDALGECLAAIDKLRGEVRDSLLAVGNRAIVAGATAYAHIKVASGSTERLKRTVEKLASRTRTPGKPPEPATGPAAAEPAAEGNPPANNVPENTAVENPTPANKAA